MAQVMKYGVYEDVKKLKKIASDDTLSEVIKHAEAGQFDEISWAFWHYRLGLTFFGNVPPLPKRNLGPEWLWPTI